jgi:ATP:cob(I)alamin adenosyltransferase
MLLDVQNRLYRVMGELATPDGSYPMPLCEEEVDAITDAIHSFEEEVQLKGFVIPGSCLASSRLDICRTVARRAERRIIALAKVDEVSPNGASGGSKTGGSYLQNQAGWSLRQKDLTDCCGCLVSI